MPQIPAQSGEAFYLRKLLTKFKDCRSWDDLRTVDGIKYGSYMETCSALGLLTNDNEWQDAIRENAKSAMPFQLRQLFVYIITNCQVSDPLKLWSDN